MNHLLKEGYQILVGGRALTKLNRDHGHGIAALKHKFDFPGDYVPGKDDDLSDNFHAGSMAMNGEKQVFMCVDDTEGQANWIHMGSLAENATEGSYINEVVESMQEATGGEEKTKEPETKTTSTDGDVSTDDEEGDGKQADTEDEDTAEAEESDESEADKDLSEDNEEEEESVESLPENDGSSDNFQMGADSGPNKGKTAIPEDMPWGKYLKNKNDLKTVEEVQKISEEGDLTDLSYINEDRADEIRKWLDEN